MNESVSCCDAGAGEGEGVASSEMERLRVQTIHFNRTTTERPQDLQVWLDFADFQDEQLG
jgi:hypothetical protein